MERTINSYNFLAKVVEQLTNRNSEEKKQNKVKKKLIREWTKIHKQVKV